MCVCVCYVDGAVCVCPCASGVLAMLEMRDRSLAWTLAHLAEGPGCPSTRPGDVGRDQSRCQVGSCWSKWRAIGGSPRTWPLAPQTQ